MKFLPIIAGLLIVIEIILTNQLVGSGNKMQSIDIIIDDLRQENALLEQKIASASSLMTVAVKAGEMGFINPTKSQYLTVAAEMPVALNNPR